MRRIILIVLAVLTAAVSVQAEPLKQGDKLPLCIGDDCSKEYPWLTNKKVREYQALEKALVDGGTAAIIKDASLAGCFDQLKNGKKGCYAAERAAGKDSAWECYPLSPNEAPECYEAPALIPCSHRWIESAKGTKFCERCGIYAIQHVNGEWMLVPRGGRWIGAEPK